MPFTAAILVVVLSYVWLIEQHVPRSAVYVPGGLVVMLTIWHDLRHREWGFAWRALGPGLRVSVPVTLVLALLILATGAAMGMLHDRRDFLGSLAGLFVWGAAQQWVLQTVVLREAQRAASRNAGILIAALLFGAIHMPNPFLTVVTMAAALFWCWLYDRHPHIVPVAFSHALGTLAILYAFDADFTGRLRIGASFLRLDR
jgi:membrane protease YdiL (CAAX protease family)